MLARRILRLWRVLLCAGPTRLDAGNAEVLLERERHALRQALLRYKQGLAGHAALAEQLKAARARLERERAQLLPRLRLRLELGDRDSAARHALRIEAIGAELERHAGELREIDATVAALVHARDAALVGANERIEALERGIGQMRVQEALADLSELATARGALGCPDGALERVQRQIDDRRDHAAARVRVARDAFELCDPLQVDREHEALAAAALARFEAGAAAAVLQPLEIPALAPPAGTSHALRGSAN